jgi:hypothetical protein
MRCCEGAGKPVLGKLKVWLGWPLAAGKLTTHQESRASQAQIEETSLKAARGLVEDARLDNSEFQMLSDGKAGFLNRSRYPG